MENNGSFGFQGVLALLNPPDSQSGGMRRALRADSQSDRHLVPCEIRLSSNYLPQAAS